jgi:hypothetical protein
LSQAWATTTRICFSLQVCSSYSYLRVTHPPASMGTARVDVLARLCLFGTRRAQRGWLRFSRPRACKRRKVVTPRTAHRCRLAFDLGTNSCIMAAGAPIEYICTYMWSRGGPGARRHHGHYLVCSNSR